MTDHQAAAASPAVATRRLGPGDAAALAELATVFGTAFADVETYTARRPGPAYVASVLASETAVVRVAEPAGSAISPSPSTCAVGASRPR